jgi:hypothetical protein
MTVPEVSPRIRMLIAAIFVGLARWVELIVTG